MPIAEKKYDNNSLGCVVTNQEDRSRSVLRAFQLTRGFCSNVMSAHALANDLHGFSPEARVIIGLRKKTGR